MRPLWKSVILFFTVLQSSSAEECGVGQTPDPFDKIVGGRSAKEGELPWQASLQRKSSLGFFHVCGASLVSRDWLVTAAHCIRDKVDNYRIVIGSNNLTAATEDMTYKIKMIVIKQGYNATVFHNDMALIQLSTQMPESLSAICLTNTEPQSNTTGVIAGWGATTDGGKPSPYLLVAEVVIIPREDCLEYFEDLTDSVTCAGYDEGGIDACQGDSGGPLLQWRDGRAYLVGIVSFGVGCAEPKQPGVYTDVFQFLSWIKHYVQPAS